MSNQEKVIRIHNASVAAHMITAIAQAMMVMDLKTVQGANATPLTLQEARSYAFEAVSKKIKEAETC